MKNYDMVDAINSSSLKEFRLGQSPQKYLLMKNHIVDKKSRALDMGTMIHSYLLEKDEFNNIYIESCGETPSSKAQEDFCNLLIGLEKNIEQIDTTDLIESYGFSYATANKSAKKIMEESDMLFNKFKYYINVKLTRPDAIFITSKDMALLENIESNVNAHKRASKLLIDKSDKHLLSYNELPIYFKYKEQYKEHDCKSRLDRVLIDTKLKKIIIVDLKTTKSLSSFDWDFKIYKYDEQLAFYKKAVQYLVENDEFFKSYEDFTIEVVVIAIQFNPCIEIKVVIVPVPVLQFGTDSIENKFKALDWHIFHDKWTHSKEYYESETGYEYLKWDEVYEKAYTSAGN